MIVGFPCGAIHEKTEVQGISHVLEHMMFRSTSYRKSVALVKAFMHLGVQWNAYTDYDTTLYLVKCPSSVCIQVTKLLLDITGNLQVVESEFKVEQRIVLEELNLDDPVTTSLFNIMYKGTPYNASIIGTKESIGAITLPVLKEYHKTHYGCPQIVVACHRSLNNKVASLLPKCDVALPMIMNMNHGREFTNQQRIVIRGNSEYGHIAYLGFPASDPRSVVCRFIAFVLSARLFRELREKRGMVYGARTVYRSMMHIGHFVITLKSGSRSIPAMLSILKQQIKRLGRITPAKFNTYLDAFTKQRALAAADTNLNYLERYTRHSLYGSVQSQQSISLDQVKAVCNEVFTRDKCAFKFHSKSSIALCLENVL